MPYIEGTKQKNSENPNINNASGILSQGATTNQGQNTNRNSNSGSWNNLQNYVNQNQNIGNNKIRETSDQYANQIKQGYEPVSKNIDSAKQDIEGAKYFGDWFKNNNQNPTNGTNTQYNYAMNNIAGYKPRYTQEQASNDITNANTNRNLNVQALKNISTGGGMTNYLNDLNKNGNYSQGSNSLDRLLIGNTDQGKSDTNYLNSIANRYENYNPINTDFYNDYDNIISGMNSIKSNSDEYFRQLKEKEDMQPKLNSTYQLPIVNIPELKPIENIVNTPIQPIVETEIPFVNELDRTGITSGIIDNIGSDSFRTRPNEEYANSQLEYFLPPPTNYEELKRRYELGEI